MKIFFVLAIIGLVGCSRNKNESLSDRLVGEWRNTYLKVEMKSYQNRDTTVVMLADTSNWEHVLGIKPIRTFFLKNGTYHSDHYSLSDSLLFSASGSWSVKGDTLLMDEVKPAVESYRMKTLIDNNQVEFSGLLDFDGDGHVDDFYLGRQQRIQ